MVCWMNENMLNLIVNFSIKQYYFLINKWLQSHAHSKALPHASLKNLFEIQK